MKKILIIILLVIATIKISMAQGAGFSSGTGYPSTSMITQGIVSYYRTTTQGANAPKWYDLNATGTGYTSRDSCVNLSVRSGTATLVAGTVVITNATVTANSIIVATHRTGIGAVGILTVPLTTRIAGTSFAVNSVQVTLAILATDNSTFDWIMIN